MLPLNSFANLDSGYLKQKQFLFTNTGSFNSFHVLQVKFTYSLEKKCRYLFKNRSKCENLSAIYAENVFGYS